MASLKDIINEEPPPAPPAPPPPASPPPQTQSHPPSVQDTPTAKEQDSMPPKRKATGDDNDDATASPRPERGDWVDEVFYSGITTSTRHTKNGTLSSVYSGNKIRHLKKDDGIPLWRKDIQFDFLKLVFDDQTRCFTKFSDGTKNNTFADIYVDAMAKSSKTSKILKEKLLQDQEGAISMAMVCLLVNFGRMNTTLNFFPEMRAQLRTYHSIPALQAQQDPNAYKQLQDAPRLKSILKGATEDVPQPCTMEDIRAAPIPRTNPVNLIFVMSQYAPKISELHFPQPRDFFDLVMRSSLSSASRANAFLWLIWWYLESNFSAEDSQRNPFGPGQYAEEEEESTGVVPQRVPTLESLTEEQAKGENVDTEDEIHFGEVKRKERIAILASEPSPAMTALKRARKEKGLTTGHHPMPSDDEGSESGYHRPGPTSVGRSALYHETGSEYTRSPSPAAGRGFPSANAKSSGDMRINNLLNDEGGLDSSPPQAQVTASTAAALSPAPAQQSKKGPGRGNYRRNRNKDANSASTGALSSQPVPLLPNTGQMQFVNNGPLQVSGKPGQSSFSYTANSLAAANGQSPSNNASFQSPTTARDHIPTPSYQAQKRHRGITQHQSAVITHRRLQIEYMLDKRIRVEHENARNRREMEGCILRAWKRIRHMPTDYDSEEEAIKIRKAKDRAEKNDDDWRSVHRGKDADEFLDNVELWRRPRVLHAGFVKVNGERTDVGEEVKSLAQSFRRASRRVERWQSTSQPGESMAKRLQMEAQDDNTGSRPRTLSRNPSTSSDGPEERLAPKTKTPRRRSGKSRGGERKKAQDEDVDKMDVDPEPDDDDGDGGVELDEEERELLGEVDADEDEDEDEEMED